MTNSDGQRFAGGDGGGAAKKDAPREAFPVWQQDAMRLAQAILETRWAVSSHTRGGDGAIGQPGGIGEGVPPSWHTRRRLHTSFSPRACPGETSHRRGRPVA